MLSNVVVNGYFVNGINNTRIRLYPQVLGIHKVHEHNLCNALRDFGLMIKSDSRKELLSYNYDFIKFLHLMRSSEICMIAHGYSQLQLKDFDWWDQFTNIAADSVYDMDGKEIAGFIYSLSKVYRSKHPLICKLLNESLSWVEHASPASLSLLIKVVTTLRFDSNYLKPLNQRAIELIDQLNIVDIVFFMTSNTDARTHDISLYKLLCIRSIELIDEIELHHLRAIAASLSMGGYKSHFMFNILTIRLIQLASAGQKMKEGDVISLFLAFTTQKFIFRNDLDIDFKLYKNFINKHLPKSSRSKFNFPLIELSPVFSDALVDNITRITSNGMPIVLRAVSILDIQLSEEFMEILVDKTCKYMEEDLFRGLKLSNLVLTFVKFKGKNDKFWESVDNLLNRNNDLQLNGDLISKMITTVGGCGILALANRESKHRFHVYKKLIELSLPKFCEMNVKSLVALSRLFLANQEYDIAASDGYIEAINDKIDEIDLLDLLKILRVFSAITDIKPFKNDAFDSLLSSVRNKIENSNTDNIHCEFAGLLENLSR